MKCNPLSENEKEICIKKYRKLLNFFAFRGNKLQRWNVFHFVEMKLNTKRNKENYSIFFTLSWQNVLVRYFPVLGNRNLNMNRSSQRSCSLKKSVVRNSKRLTGKHQCQSLFLIKLYKSIKKINSVFPLCGIKRDWWNIFHFLKMKAKIFVSIYTYIHFYIYLYIYIYIYIYIKYIYKVKLNNELTLSRKKTQFCSYYIIFLLSSKFLYLRPGSQNNVLHYSLIKDANRKA